MKKQINLRRKELMGHLPKEIRAGANTWLSSVYVNRQPLKGVEGEEEIEFLNGVLDVSPEHVDWPKHVKQFWTELAIKIPFEGVELEVGLDGDGKPYNIDHYLKYRFALKHPFVALTKEKMSGRQKYYVHDPKGDIISKNKQVKASKEADKEFIKLTTNGKKMDRVLRLMSDYNPITLTSEQKENYLYEIKNKEPKKFFKICTDKNLDFKSEIEEMVEAGVLRKIGNQVVYIDEVIGETTEDTIVYLKNKKNSGILTILRAKLKEAVV
tara:strand:+ start:397 stop:1200 length:804 start_codon:yes stop_codon:yes gene_type:complete